MMQKTRNLLIGVAIATTVGSTSELSGAMPIAAPPAQPATTYEYVKSHTTLIRQIRRSGINVPLPKLEYDPNVIFDPNGARSMKIIGVVQNPGRVQVMLKPRQSNAIQVVAVGGFFNNGQTLVKKVDRINTIEPIVTFEEDGIEIQRRVGEN